MRVASFFAGVGGIDLGFLQAGFEVIWANEFDVRASQTYRSNFSSTLLTEDIRKVKASAIPDFDIMVGGFPCQAFSLAGKLLGFGDERGNLFFELERILKEKKPKAVFLENVKNLINHDNGNTYRVIWSRLTEAGYFVREQIMNSCEYGNLPQNRERIYIVGFRDRKVYERFYFPRPIPLTTKLSDCINMVEPVEENFYYRQGTCQFYEPLALGVQRSNTLYQWRRHYVRQNRRGLCPTLTANMGTGGHNVPIVKTKFGIRKLTPRECFNFMGYPKDYKLPNLNNSCLYKQAGNSVTVPVIKRIAETMKSAIEEQEPRIERYQQLQLF